MGKGEGLCYCLLFPLCIERIKAKPLRRCDKHSLDALCTARALAAAKTKGDAMLERKMTVADYAATVADLSHLPQFEMSPAIEPHPLRGWFEWPDEGDPAPAGPLPPARLHNRKVSAKGKADPIWDTAFAIKFKRKAPTNDTPLVMPRGTAAPSPRQAELEFLEATQNDELATTYDVFIANGIEATRLDATKADGDPEAAEFAEHHLNRTPYCVRLPDEPVTGPDGKTVMVPAYGNLTYIANMKRRIEWEKAMSANGPLERAYFEPTKSGECGIGAASKSRDADHLTALRRRVKTRWLETHESLPDVQDIEAATLRVNGMHVLDVIDPEELRIQKERWAWEDPDPGRVPFHADPDPKPLREQYAFGAHTRKCHYWQIPADQQRHVGCTQDGWDLYNLDLVLWQKRQEDLDEVGYAGPSGLLGVDIDSIPDFE